MMRGVAENSIRCAYCKATGQDPNYTFTPIACPVCNGLKRNAVSSIRARVRRISRAEYARLTGVIIGDKPK